MLFILESYAKYSFAEILERCKVKICLMCHRFYQFMGSGMPKIASSERAKTEELRNAQELCIYAV